MRWMVALLLVACTVLLVACTHAQPPPPPLAVPPANAAAPARPENAPGTAGPPGVSADAGPVPDAGPAADAGPAPAVADAGPAIGERAPDIASPMTAAGTEAPLGLDWGATGDKPAAEIFKNVKVLGGLSGNRFMAAMQSMRANLGQKCVFCHDVPKQNYTSDDKKTKQRARQMMRMNDEINHRTFAGKVRVTCWTCHRGDEEPPKMEFSKELSSVFTKLMPASQLEQPAEKVFKDVKQLTGMKARQFGLIMGWFGKELGVKCTHCHKEDDFAADTEKKTMARTMLEMTGYVARGYYGNDSPIGCGTCHRGSVKPPRTPADVPGGSRG